MVQRALATGMARFADHNVLTLSGGELQRTFLAQLFAQDPKVLLLDELTNHLDLVYQKQVFGLIAESDQNTRPRGDFCRARSQPCARLRHESVAARRREDGRLWRSGGRIFPERLNEAYAMDVAA
ncbi:MAG: ATP-binding cassette domain-containing protein [Eubacteriales bacterium]